MKPNKRKQARLLREMFYDTHRESWKRGYHSGRIDTYKEINSFICKKYHKIEHEYDSDVSFIDGFTFAEEQKNKACSLFQTPLTPKVKK